MNRAHAVVASFKSHGVDDNLERVVGEKLRYRSLTSSQNDPGRDTTRVVPPGRTRTGAL